MLTFSKKKTEQALVTIQGTVPKHMLLSILVRVLLMCRKQMALKRAADQRGLSVSEAEAYLTGKKPDATTLAETAKLAAKAATPSADRRGSVEYKREMARVLAGRALKAAVSRAGGK